SNGAAVVAAAAAATDGYADRGGGAEAGGDRCATFATATADALSQDCVGAVAERLDRRGVGEINGAAPTAIAAVSTKSDIETAADVRARRNGKATGAATTADRLGQDTVGT